MNVDSRVENGVPAWCTGSQGNNHCFFSVYESLVCIVWSIVSALVNWYTRTGPKMGSRMATDNRKSSLALEPKAPKLVS